MAAAKYAMIALSRQTPPLKTVMSTIRPLTAAPLRWFLLCAGLSLTCTASTAETDTQYPPFEHNLQIDEPCENRHYNRLLRTQLNNLWAYAEGAVITRAVRQAFISSGEQSRRAPGVQTSAVQVRSDLGSPADILGAVLHNIYLNVRSGTSAGGKKFLITEGAYSSLVEFMKGNNIEGMDPADKTYIKTLIGKIEVNNGISMKQAVLDGTRASTGEQRGAISIESFVPLKRANEEKWLSQRGSQTTQADSSTLPDAQTITRRMEHARANINWKDQLLRQTLAGAMVGAGVEAVITVTYKSVYEQRPPWTWEDSDIAEVAMAIAGGALTGAVSTAATWALRGNSQSGIRLWMASTIVTGSMHLLKESAKIATFSEDALSVQQLAESMPAILVMSLGAYFGEQLSPIPLVGAIAGAVSGRIATGLAHSYLQTYLNTPSVTPHDIQQAFVNEPTTMPAHISVGIIRPVDENQN